MENEKRALIFYFIKTFNDSAWQWLWSNLVPHGDPDTAPQWYETVIMFVNQHKDILSRLKDSELNTRTLMKFIQQPHQMRCVVEWDL